MGINIGIMEMEAPSAPCRTLRSETVRVHMADVSGFEDAAVYDEFVPYEKAKAAFPDWEAFVKRNRLNEDASCSARSPRGGAPDGSSWRGSRRTAGRRRSSVPTMR